jgi:hypothetical protein
MMFLLSLLGLLGLLSFLVMLAASLTARDGFEDEMGLHFLDEVPISGVNAGTVPGTPSQRNSEQSYPKRAA